MTGDRCITCSDEGLVLRVVAVDCAATLAHCVDETGEAADVDVALVDPVAPGDALLVHAGVALRRLTREEAAA